MNRALLITLLGVGAVGASACTPTVKSPPPVDPNNHLFFPIKVGDAHELGKAIAVDGTVECVSCHRKAAESFTYVRCDGCHKHALAVTPRLHLGVPDFPVDTSGTTDPDVQAEIRGRSCINAGCHPAADRKSPFSHTGIAAAPGNDCQLCHAEGAAFASLPKPNFTHPNMGGTDCSGCHLSTTDWAQVTRAPNGLFDPLKSLTVTGLIPSFTGPTITRVSPQVQTLNMPMNHDATSVDAGVLSDCAVCHLDPNSRYPGLMHSSLASLGVPQPQQCAECHLVPQSQPIGFVGPTAAAPVRTPPSGEMRHDAVLWADGGPTATRVLSQDCAVCHRPPDNRFSAWTNGDGDGGVPLFHASLTAASQPQPGSCIDCHANTRPTALLTSLNATLPTGLTFDHQDLLALGDCSACHVTTAWSGGHFHQGQPMPPTCAGCHEAERPTSTTGWQSTTYTTSPFDYGTNSQGITHGGGEDCAVCHAGSTSTWVGGAFSHGPTTLAAQTCFSCHVSQRPTAVVMNFDHSQSGTGECRACHQATVTRGSYVTYPGDWSGGREYPGDVLVTSPTQFVQVPAYTLTKNGSGFVTGLTNTQLTLFNGMLHTSAVIPTQLQAGPAGMPDSTTCWHCHTHNPDGGVTSFANGVYHQAFASYAATPGGTVTPLTQPTTTCLDCHEQMRPNLVVEKTASALIPMDHSATFTAAVTLGGQSVTGVAGVDCAVCHATSPGTTWADGKFHPSIAGATPSNCLSCHYRQSTTAQADLTSGTTFAMRHRSTTLGALQACETCHPTALGKASMMPSVATLWATGTLHPHVTAQPTLCLDCHAPSEPSQATQSSTVVWTFATGGTSTNGAQWMNHQVADVQGRDCAVCHQNDAKAAGSAWDRATTRFHPRVANPAGCAVCHGTTNGRGAVNGTNNNLPAALTSSRTTTTSSASPGLPDQVSHADVNVTGHDCSFCHTQKGTSTTPGVQGAEWKQAQFHLTGTAPKFTNATPLVMNLTSGRCSNCHLNLKPPASFTAFDHAAFTGASGSPDCGSCHSWPGTNAAMPNWLGAAAMPPFISVGGFTIPVPPATSANTLQVGIANLPHPTPGTGVMCVDCHAGMPGGGRRAIGYDHLSTLINSNCNSCHEAGSDLVGTVWNGATAVANGLGDTRPFTLTSVPATYKGNTTNETYPKHFFPIDCKECHVVPTGLGLTATTNAVLRTQWKFPHTIAKMTNPATCLTCHPNGAPN